MKKTRILIVDDDTMVRIGLKTVINWEENGFLLVGEAQDGQQALELAERYQPDIIITDIKMPRMDGLVLIEQLREQKNPADILVLSSYDEFELVKKALKLGAKDYILKLNLEPEELLRCLHMMVASQTDRPASSDVAPESEKSRTLLRQNFLWDVVSGFYLSEEKMEQTMRYLEIHLDTRPIYCMILKAGETYRFEDAPPEQLQTLRFSVINITDEIVNDVANGYCFSGRTGEFDVLLTGVEDRVTLTKLAQRLRRMLMDYLNLSCTVLVGSSQQPGSAGIQEAFRQANALVSRRFFLDHDGVLFWDGAMEEHSEESYSLSGVRAELSDILVTGSTESLARVLNRIAEDMRRLSLSRSTICGIALELFYVVQEYFEKNALPTKRLLPQSYRTYEQFVHMESLRDVIDWLELLRQDLTAFFDRESEKGYPKVIRAVQDWIAAHYRENASLQEAAAAVGFNPSYLSTLLKKYTGKSYTESLAEYRIEQAKQLLLLTNEKVYAVGQMVGYEDKYYFNRIFKRVTGMSPGEFKNQNRKE